MSVKAEERSEPYLAALKALRVLIETEGLDKVNRAYEEALEDDIRKHAENIPKASTPALPLDQDLLHTILSGVKKGLAQRGTTLSPDKEAELINLLYNYHSKTRETQEAAGDTAVQLVEEAVAETGVQINERQKSALVEIVRDELKSRAKEMDKDLLSSVISGVEKGLNDLDLVMDPDKKAQLIILLYDHYAKTQETADDKTVERYLKSALNEKE